VVIKVNPSRPGVTVGEKAEQVGSWEETTWGARASAETFFLRTKQRPLSSQTCVRHMIISNLCSLTHRVQLDCSLRDGWSMMMTPHSCVSLYLDLRSRKVTPSSAASVMSSTQVAMSAETTAYQLYLRAFLVTTVRFRLIDGISSSRMECVTSLYPVAAIYDTTGLCVRCH
jgi:hypothetical protein